MCHYSLQSHFDLDKERYVFLTNVGDLQFQYRVMHRRLYEDYWHILQPELREDKLRITGVLNLRDMLCTGVLISS